MSAVPALQRGFAILELLNQHDALSLEEITVSTEFPRASVLRMLETLCDIGVISKDKATRRYRALRMLVSKGSSFKERLRAVLDRLAADCDACVEWYQRVDGGMRIVERFSAPQNEVQVLARIGFLREWFVECEAVNAIALSHTEKAQDIPTGCTLWQYAEAAERKALTRRALNSILRQAADEHIYCDPLYNENGIRRMAVPVMQDGALAGIIALAMSFRPQLEKHLDQHAQRLQEAAVQLDT